MKFREAIDKASIKACAMYQGEECKKCCAQCRDEFVEGMQVLERLGWKIVGPESSEEALEWAERKDCGDYENDALGYYRDVFKHILAKMPTITDLLSADSAEPIITPERRKSK